MGPSCLDQGKTIIAQFYDSGEDTAFVVAVEQNIAYGLPLSLVDREAAAGSPDYLPLIPNW